jgi:hypothetical protein
MIVVEIENVMIDDYYVIVRNHLKLVVVRKFSNVENEMINLSMNFHSMLKLFEDEAIETWMMFEMVINEIVDG